MGLTTGVCYRHTSACFVLCVVLRTLICALHCTLYAAHSLNGHQVSAQGMAIEDAQDRVLLPLISLSQGPVNVDYTIVRLVVSVVGVTIDVAHTPGISQLVVQLSAARDLDHPRLPPNWQMETRHKVREADNIAMERFHQILLVEPEHVAPHLILRVYGPLRIFVGLGLWVWERIPSVKGGSVP